jgi:hypothetical protein
MPAGQIPGSCSFSLLLVAVSPSAAAVLICSMVFRYLSALVVKPVQAITQVFKLTGLTLLSLGLRTLETSTFSRSSLFVMSVATSIGYFFAAPTPQTVYSVYS